MKNKKPVQSSVITTAIIMMSMTLCSKLLGFCRELVIADSFGTSYVVDAYVLALSIPSILTGGFSSAICTAYTPVYSKLHETQGRERGYLFTGKIINLTTATALIIFLTGFLLSDRLVLLFARNFSAEALALTGFYLKIAFAFPVVSCALDLLNAYLQYHEHFFIPIFGGYLYNAGIILMALISARADARLLIFGMLLGYSIQLLMTGIFTGKTGYRHRLDFAPDITVRQTLQLALPMFFGTSVYSLNTLVDKTLASTLPEGSIAALNYGNLIIALITGLTSSIIVTILYPKLTQAMSRGNSDEFQSLAAQSVSVLLLIGIPLSLGAAVFSRQVVQVIYERGAFDAASTVLTGEAFCFYGLGIVFLAVNDLLGRVFFSMQDTKTPLLCATVSIAVNITLNLLLVGPMAHRGLALATSIAAAINTFAMYFCLRKRYPQLHLFPPPGKLARILLSAALAVGLAVITYRLLQYVALPQIIHLGLSVLTAAAAYLLLLVCFKTEELSLLRNLLHRK